MSYRANREKKTPTPRKIQSVATAGTVTNNWPIRRPCPLCLRS